MQSQASEALDLLVLGGAIAIVIFWKTVAKWLVYLLLALLVLSVVLH